MAGRKTSSKKDTSFEAFELKPVISAKIDDIDNEKVMFYLRKKAEKMDSVVEEVSRELLERIGAVRKVKTRYIPTVCGLLLFGKAPQKHLPTSKIRMARFKGTDRKLFIDRAEIEGSLYELVDKAMEFVCKNIRLGAVVRSTQREEFFEYPLDVIREALTNAIVHRDYQVGGENIMVAIYDDRIEITNPGDLPGDLTVDTIANGRSILRNQCIAHRMLEMGYMEDWGRGIKLMIDGMQNHKIPLPAPLFEEVGYAFRVTLKGPGEEFMKNVDTNWKGTITEGITNIEHSNIEQPNVEHTVKIIEKWMYKLTDREIKAIEYIRDRGWLTNRIYRELTGVKKSQAVKDLMQMVDNNMIVIVRKGRSSYYFLSQSMEKKLGGKDEDKRTRKNESKKN